MPKLTFKSGFSLVEVVVASLIFSIAVVGLFTTFSGLRTTSNESEKRLLAANYGREILEDLRASVDERDWSAAGSKLSIGIHNLPNVTARDGTVYTREYTVAPVGNGRQARATISWTR